MMIGIRFVTDEFDYGTLRFCNAAQYIRLMHPEYRFALAAVSKVVNRGAYTREQAITIQSDMLAEVCAEAKKHDLKRGLTIVIQDESCVEKFSDTVPARSANRAA